MCYLVPNDDGHPKELCVASVPRHTWSSSLQGWRLERRQIHKSVFFFFYNGSCVSCLCFLWVRWRREAWQNPALLMFSGEHKFLLIEHTSEKLSSEGEVILPPASQVSYVVGGKRIYCSRTSVGGFKNLTDPPWLKPGRASRLVLGTETWSKEKTSPKCLYCKMK